MGDFASLSALGNPGRADGTLNLGTQASDHDAMFVRLDALLTAGQALETIVNTLAPGFPIVGTSSELNSTVAGDGGSYVSILTTTPSASTTHPNFPAVSTLSEEMRVTEYGTAVLGNQAISNYGSAWSFTYLPNYDTHYYGAQTTSLRISADVGTITTPELTSFADLNVPFLLEYNGTLTQGAGAQAGPISGSLMAITGLVRQGPNVPAGADLASIIVWTTTGNVAGQANSLGYQLAFANATGYFADGAVSTYAATTTPFEYARGVTCGSWMVNDGTNGTVTNTHVGGGVSALSPLVLSTWPQGSGGDGVGPGSWNIGFWDSPPAFTMNQGQLIGFQQVTTFSGLYLTGGVQAYERVGFFFENAALTLGDPTAWGNYSGSTFNLASVPSTLTLTSITGTLPASGYAAVGNFTSVAFGTGIQYGTIHYTGTSGGNTLTGVTFVAGSGSIASGTAIWCMQAPSLREQVGIQIQPLSAATTNIGIRNWSVTVHPSTSVTITAPSTTIPTTAGTVEVSCGGSAFTMSANPFGGGVDGQSLDLIMTSGGSLTIPLHGGGSVTLVKGQGQRFVYVSSLAASANGPWCAV